ncbi:MAG: hypothetical protein JWN78_1124 [Bacteroidota bacterium]|nr:hypothetical protein [Bacteroidota bacterium]
MKTNSYELKNLITENMSVVKKSILGIFCAILLIGTTSCSRGSGCGTWGKLKQKQNNNQYMCYHPKDKK